MDEFMGAINKLTMWLISWMLPQHLVGAGNILETGWVVLQLSNITKTVNYC